MKAIIVTGLALMIFCSTSFSQVKTKTFKVGEFVGGGIVCYVEENGKHGLIASVEDICTEVPFLIRGSGSSSVSGEPNPPKIKYRTSDVDGFANTKMIIKSGYNHGAAWSCDEYHVNNSRGWYLPSIEELEKLVKSGPEIDQILNNDDDPETYGLTYAYWSSTSCLSGSYGTCTWIYKDGSHRVNMYDYKLNVRAVKKF